MLEVAQWGIFEQALQSDHSCSNPVSDVSLRAVFTSPSGKQRQVAAFWDGRNIWRLRFSPDEPGIWHWHSECSDPTDTGMHAQSGSFHCTPYEDANPLYRHGRLRLSENRRHFVYADGAPFFWLSDTAWNGVIRAKKDDWEQYLTTRASQAFTAIQFVTTHWRAASADPRGEVAFHGSDPIAIDPAFFQPMDAKITAINQHGLAAAPVVLWACTEADPGSKLSEQDATLLARYLVARWGAHHVIWLLGGDGDYRGDRAERWRRIGRAVFGEQGHHLVTMHPGGLHWVADEFRRESWFSFTGYQSGHGDSEDDLRWLVHGPPAQEWVKEPPRPIINLEPNYETHPAYQSRRLFTAAHVRRAAYWSLLLAPTAGVTYGHNAIWPWREERGEPEGHDYIGTVPPWKEGLSTPGIQSMVLLRRLFDSGPWWRLQPAPGLLVERSEKHAVDEAPVAASTEDGDWALIYLPRGGSFAVRADLLRRPTLVRWFNPRTGDYINAGGVAREKHTFITPDEEDWVWEATTRSS
jgi:hypothetical protein